MISSNAIIVPATEKAIVVYKYHNRDGTAKRAELPVLAWHIYQRGIAATEVIVPVVVPITSFQPKRNESLGWTAERYYHRDAEELPACDVPVWGSCFPPL